MTKGLKKTLHRKHAGFLLAEFRNGELFGLDGTALDLGRVVPRREALYQVEPPGLGKPSARIDKLDRVSTFDFADGFEERPKAQSLERPPIAVAAAGEEEKMTQEDRAVQLVLGACGELIKCLICVVLRAVARAVVGKQAAAVAELLSGCLQGAMLSEGMQLALKDAILDSGASQTYVTSRVQLENVQPGEGYVRVATGRREAVTESGDLGPIKGAQKVDGFARTLVSVMDVAEQVGNVLFTPNAAFVLEKGFGAGDAASMTKIADATYSRLYSFDVVALDEHGARLRGGKAVVGAVT